MRRLKAVLRGLARRWDLLVAGGAAAMAMPGPGPWWLILPALAWLYRRSFGAVRPFADGWLFGIAYFTGSLSWIWYVVHVYGYMHPVLALVPLALLTAYMALYVGVAQKLTAMLSSGDGRWRWLLWAVALAAFEDARGRLLTGFSWNPIGLSLIDALPLTAPLTTLGITGLSFLVAALAAAAVEAHRRSGLTLVRRIGPLVLVLAAWGLSGLPAWLDRGEIVAGPGAEDAVSFALIQGSIEQDVKWDDSMREITIQRYEDLTRRAVAVTGPLDLVVWPETAMPFYFQRQSEYRSWVTRVADGLDVPLLFGAPAYRFPEGTDTPDLFNRAYLLDGDGEPVAFYDKRHLVPFGEYVPLKPILFFVEKIVRGLGNFAPGPGPFPLRVGELHFGVVICYEAIFPYEVREAVALGADFLVQITNDAWFGNTAAPYQHLALAQLRAIENGVPILRAANTGVTAYIDRRGRVHQPTRLYKPAWIRGTVARGEPTPFARFGGVWAAAWALAALALAGRGLRQWWRRRRAGAAASQPNAN